MAVGALAKGILSVISQARKINKIKMNAPIKFRHYSSGVGEETYDKFLKDFSNQYKKLNREDFTKFKKGIEGISHNLWWSTQQNAKNRGLITSADTRKAQFRPGQEGLFKIGELNPSILKQVKLKEERRKALLSVWQDISDEAFKDKKGRPLLNKWAFNSDVTIPRLKKKFPSLFEGIENDIIGQRALRGVVRKSGHKGGPFPTRLEKPEISPIAKGKSSHPEGQYMGYVLPNYIGEGIGHIGRQYWDDLFRSRGSDFRTRSGARDIHNFLKFERSQGALDPASPYYYKKNPEFLDYYLTRKRQPIGMELAHDRPTLNPQQTSKRFVPSETVPGSGGEIGFTQFLERDINRKWQPYFENMAYEAIVAKRYDKLAKIDSEMIKRNIRTRITDPNTGEEILMGGWKEFGFNRGGIASLRVH